MSDGKRRVSEPRTEWVMFAGLLIEPTTKKKYEAAILRLGFRTMAEEIRDHMRRVVEKDEKSLRGEE